MEPLTIIAYVATSILTVVGGVLGAKYKKIKTNFLKSIKLIKEIEKVLEDGEVSPKELQDLIDYYREEIQ